MSDRLRGKNSGEIGLPNETHGLSDHCRELRSLITETLAFIRQMATTAAGTLYRVRRDLLIASLLGLAAALFAVWRFYALDFAVLTYNFDVWFGADTPRIVGANLDHESGMHNRSTVHPLFPLFVSLPTIVIYKFALGGQAAIAASVGAAAFLFMAAFYGAARSIGLRWLDAIVLSTLMLSTAGSMYWLPIPESFVLGSVSMMVSLIWLMSKRGPHDALTGPLQSMFALSFTLTNWMAGLWAAVLALGPRRAIWVSVVAFAAVSALSIPQKLVFPSAGHPFNFKHETDYMWDRETSVPDRLATISQPLLAAKAQTTEDVRGQTVLEIGPYTPSTLLIASVLGWLALVILAVEAFVAGAVPPRARAFLFVIVAAQLLLHAVYGYTYHLYSLHFLPFGLLILGAALLGRRRRLALVVVGLTALVSGAYNFQHLADATQMYNEHTPLKPAGAEQTEAPAASP
jgi:hypothetical protein